MKNSNIIIAILSILFIVSCNNNDNVGEIKPVTNATATPFIGSVKLSWTAPSDSNYYYTLITYKNSEGKILHKKVSRYDAVKGLTTTTVGGFSDTNAHDFTLTTHSFSGASSSEVKLTGTPEDVSGAKDYVLGTVNVNPANEGASVVWTNESGVDVKLIITYTDMLNVNMCDTVDAQKSDSVVLSGFTSATNVSVVAYNVSDGAKSISKTFSVTPIIDTDDVIYSNIEYLTLQVPGTRTTVTQDDPYPYGKYEYTIVVTGSDPHNNINSLKHPKAGTILKFRYMATQDWTLEVFWADKGGGAAGGRSTRVTIPAASTWTTFSYDYGSEITKYNWAGKVGDFFRFDEGDNGGVTIHLRNMHFE
jgi:hypothetical protein